MKVSMIKSAAFLMMLALPMFLSAQGYGKKMKKDVVDVAMGSEAHTTLVAAVKAADLVSTLKGEGPFTVFAPTNEAFAALPDGTVESLLKPENKEKLTAVLTYHVVAGKLMAKDVLAAIENADDGMVNLETVQGGTLTAYAEDGDVYLKDENDNTAKITAVDLKGSNGVIHVINSVVLPK